MKKVLLGMVVVLGLCSAFMMSTPASAACNPDEECHRCLLHRPSPPLGDGGCIQEGKDPVCEARKAVCQQCANIKAIATGATYACVACVLTTGPANPACIGACEGAAKAQAVAAAGNCG